MFSLITGVVNSRAPAVKLEAAEEPLSDMLAATTALAVLAETVATAAAPATPCGPAESLEAQPSAALEAISALAALGTEANSREVRRALLNCFGKHNPFASMFN